MEFWKSADVKLVDDTDLNTARFDHPVKALDTSPQRCGQEGGFAGTECRKFVGLTEMAI